jgi:D-sedoheptulose 7-phosphate isomerase
MKTLPAAAVTSCEPYPTTLTHTEPIYYVDTNNRDPKERALLLLTECFRAGGKLLLCGNGGSAADCEHIVGELMKGMNSQRAADGWAPLQPALPAISLCSQVGLLTAIVNDMGADWMFAQQVWGYGDPGDVLMCLSTSGKSMNIIRAMEFARRLKLKIIGLTGENTQHFDTYCDVVISIPGRTAAEVQEGHLRVYHELCSRLKEEFGG